MKKIKVKDLKKGQYFTKERIAEPLMNEVYILEEYFKFINKYIAVRYTNFEDEILLDGNTTVFVDFKF